MSIVDLAPKREGVLCLFITALPVGYKLLKPCRLVTLSLLASSGRVNVSINQLFPLYGARLTRWGSVLAAPQHVSLLSLPLALTSKRQLACADHVMLAAPADDRVAIGAIGAIGALMNRVLQPRPLIVLVFDATNADSFSLSGAGSAAARLPPLDPRGRPRHHPHRS